MASPPSLRRCSRFSWVRVGVAVAGSCSVSDFLGDHSPKLVPSFPAAEQRPGPVLADPPLPGPSGASGGCGTCPCQHRGACVALCPFFWKVCLLFAWSWACAPLLSRLPGACSVNTAPRPRVGVRVVPVFLPRSWSVVSEVLMDCQVQGVCLVFSSWSFALAALTLGSRAHRESVSAVRVGPADTLRAGGQPVAPHRSLSGCSSLTLPVLLTLDQLSSVCSSHCPSICAPTVHPLFICLSTIHPSIRLGSTALQDLLFPVVVSEFSHLADQDGGLANGRWGSGASSGRREAV